MQREFLRWGAQSLRNVWAKKFNPYRGMTLSVCWCVHVVCDPLLPRSGPFVRALCATHLHDPHPLVPGLQSSFHRGESCGLTTNTKRQRNRDNDGDGVFPAMVWSRAPNNGASNGTQLVPAFSVNSKAYKMERTATKTSGVSLDPWLLLDCGTSLGYY